MINKSIKTENFPDGSTKSTETTTTQVPSTGAKEVSVVITVTPKTGGGTGDAGTPGTGSGSSSGAPSVGAPGTGAGSGGDGKSASGFCADNPGLQICKGDMNKEETQIKVRDYIKSLTDPGTTPYTALSDAKQSAESDTKLKTETDKFDAIMAGTVDPAASSKSSWQAAMESGWFSPIPSSTCAPYSATIGGRTWTLNICSAAETIAGISEYVIWFGLVIGVFVMFTGGSFSRTS